MVMFYLFLIFTPKTFVENMISIVSMDTEEKGVL